MRIVEYQPDTAIAPCRAIKVIGLAAAVCALILAILMIANYASFKRSDPIHSPALLSLLEQLKSRPQDQALREEIRELDFLARRAVFSSQHFSQVAKYLLLGSLAVMVVSFKTLERYQQRLPYPDPRPAKQDLAANARWARKAVASAGLILGGLALILALPWNSPLDHAENLAPPVPVDRAESPASAPSAVAPAPGGILPSREEQLMNWPGFRGAGGGLAYSSNLPAAWDGDSNQGIAWKIAVPKAGFSSPVIWKDRIFLTGADEQSREVYCFQQQDGSLAWRFELREISGAPSELPKVSEDTGFAAPTPATDGTRVFAIFATGEIVALDFAGRRVWARALGVPDNPFGHASSLLVFERLVLVQMDHQKGGALLALDALTGETRWKVDRAFGASWSSPALLQREGPVPSVELVTAASPPVIAYDPRTGQQLWRVDCLDRGDVATVPVIAGGHLFVSGDNAALAAVNLATHTVAWEQTDLIPSVSTPVVVGERLIYGLPDGGIVCRDASSGRELWHEETDAGFYASPIVAGGRVYLFDREGTAHIIAPGATFNLIGRSKLGEPVVSTPAAAGNNLYVRGVKHLYRIGS